MSCGTATFAGLPVYTLQEVLRCVPLPSGFSAELVSPKWRCVVVPHVNSEGTVVSLLEAGLPVLWDNHLSTTENGVTYVTTGAFNEFDKPQIAVKNGWGSPGTVRDHSTHHVMVKSFTHVFHPPTRAELVLDEQVQAAMDTREIDEAEQRKTEATPFASIDGVLELQLFHREGTRLPPEAAALTWPDVLEHKVVCDMATKATQKGFQRWWGMNDCGELVLEAALPVEPLLLPSECSSSIRSSLFHTFRQSSNESALANASKLCIFGSRGSYDWFIHDDASLSNGSVVCLNLLETVDEELPKDPELLPVLMVCVLEGGGPSLLHPPNLPAMYVVLQDVVTVEQRSISYLWLDELSYFLHRCQLWSADPLIYQLVEEDFQDAAYMTSVLVPLLNELFQQYRDVHTSTAEVCRRRLVASLFAVATHPAHYALPDTSRQSLLATVTTDNYEMAAVLHGPCSHKGTWTLKEMLEFYWNTRQFWPKEGCVLCVPTLFPSYRNEAAVNWFLPVVYPPATSSPVYGSEERSVEQTLPEYLNMKRMEPHRQELQAYLRTRKCEMDTILDELF